MLYEGNRRVFFFLSQKKRCHKHPNFQAKGSYRTELWRALYQKAPMGQFLIFRNDLTEFTHKGLFPDFLGRIFQVKRQSKKVILLFSCSVFLFIIVENRFVETMYDV
jgi:hypothetical protein